MDSYRRQVSILYELISTDLYRTYKELEEKFCITEKTLRNDIKTINDLFANQGISIELEKNKGFYLKTESREKRQELCTNFDYRFVDINDIATCNSFLLHEIMSRFLIDENYIKIDDLSFDLCLNARSVTDVLKTVRHELAKYHLEIGTKPHYGMYLKGNEISIRTFYMDTISYESKQNIDIDLFEDSVSTYGLSEEDKYKLTTVCLNIFGKSKAKLDFYSIKKFVLYILISEKRFNQGKQISLNETQSTLIKSLPELESLDLLVKELEHYNFVNNYNELLCLKLFLFANANITDDFGLYLYLPNWLVCSVKKLQQTIISVLKSKGIVKNEGIERLAKMIQPLLFQYVLRSNFNIYECNTNISLRKAIKQSPLSANIGYLIHQTILSELDCNIGEMMFIRISVTIYAWIRETCNNCLSNKLALLVPFSYESGMTVKRRIMDRFANNTESIDILMPCDLPHTDINCYNALLYIDTIPHELNVKIPKLKIDFYFTENDVSNFYEHIIIPTRKYTRCFGEIKREDYIANYHYVTLKTFLIDLANQYQNTTIYNDILATTPLTSDIYNRTLSLIYFTKNKSECFSKLIELDTYDHILNARFNRVFIHVIALDGDMIGLKTTEKVARNLICIDDTKDVINEKIDFYEYYIRQYKVPLK